MIKSQWLHLSPENTLTEKLVSNLEEVKARGGTLYVFGGPNSKINIDRGAYIQMPECSELLAPIIYTIPLQILAYQVACQRGTDVDQPRNLAKSVTVSSSRIIIDMKHFFLNFPSLLFLLPSFTSYLRPYLP